MFDYPEMQRVEFGGLSSEFGCKRFYATSPPVYYMLEIWRILGPARPHQNRGKKTRRTDREDRNQFQASSRFPQAWQPLCSFEDNN